MAQEITLLLNELNNGKREALDKLLPIVYDELRRLAHRYLREEYNAETMQTTALVHEAYLKLVDQHSVDWENRGQFFAIAAQSMRRILIDNAREKHAYKRDGIKISLDNAETISVELNQSLLDLDDALNELATFDGQQVQVVELRYFGGLTIEETAQVLKISTATVKREWAIARAWLFQKINGEPI